MEMTLNKLILQLIIEPHVIRRLYDNSFDYRRVLIHDHPDKILKISDQYIYIFCDTFTIFKLMNKEISCSRILIKQ